MKQRLKARDVERLENTSFVAAALAPEAPALDICGSGATEHPTVATCNTVCASAYCPCELVERTIAELTHAPTARVDGSPIEVR